MPAVSVSVSPCELCLVDSMSHVLLVSSIFSESPHSFQTGFLTGLLLCFLSTCCVILETSLDLSVLFSPCIRWEDEGIILMPGYMILVRASASLAAPSPNMPWHSDKAGLYPITGYTLIALKHSYLYRLKLICELSMHFTSGNTGFSCSK